MTTDVDEARLDRIENSLARIEEWMKHHDRIHGLEEKARDRALQTLSEDLEDLNDVRTRFIPRETFDLLATKVDVLDSFRSRAVGAAVVLTLLAGTVGAAIARAFN